MIDLDEAERTGNVATKGPWHNAPSWPEHVPLSNQIWQDSLYLGEFKTPWQSHENNTHNAAFVCYARNHWQEMVDEIRRLRSELSTLRERGSIMPGVTS